MKKILYNGENIQKDPIELSQSLSEHDYEEYLYQEYFKSNSLNSDWNQYWTGNSSSPSMVFRVGNIYCFEYYGNRDTSNLDIYDMMPLVLITDVYKKGKDTLIKGINLNYMKKEVKLKFMHFYYYYFKDLLVFDVNNHVKGFNNLTKIQQNVYKEFIHKVNIYISNISLYSRTWNAKYINLENTMFVKYIDYNILPFYTGSSESIKGNLIS